MIFLHMDTREFQGPDTLSPNTIGGPPWEKKSTNMLKDVPNANKTR